MFLEHEKKDLLQQQESVCGVAKCV